MRLRRLFAVMRKEALHIFRDPRSLAVAILIPLVLMIAYCESLSLDVNNIPMVVIDPERSTDSRDLVGRFTSSGYFTLVAYVNNYREMQEYIDRRYAVMGLTIPWNFSKLLREGDKPVPVQIILDGTDPNRGNAANGYTTVICQSYSQERLKKKLDELGLTGSNIPVNPQIRIWFNPSLRSKNHLIPGLIALIMAILAGLLTSSTISREWENGTMELLISTPVSEAEIVIGKFIPYFILGSFDCVVITIVGWWVYQVPIKGSIPLLGLVIVLFMSGVLLLGLFVSASFRSTLMSTQLAFVATWLPTMLLSGFVFFIPGMPRALQYLSDIVPAKYFITCTRGIYLKGVGAHVLAEQLIFLAIFDVLMIILTTFRFKKTLDVK